MKQKSLGIDPKKVLADELHRILIQLNGGICSDVAGMLMETGEADLVFQFKLLKNGKLRLKVGIWDDNLKATR